MAIVGTVRKWRDAAGQAQTQSAYHYLSDSFGNGRLTWLSWQHLRVVVIKLAA